ncbi:WD40 repeat domain-containing protein [Candidatus Oscillochloris fontis]|uniref:WD40 repeat domain-containing protein n=1 Tax=Candidatus Oscillochloris fontis TaxID=2496868 RepID=UPI00101D1084|nr:hypothetical protein [Candidatus Oscillochloris fontis]
MRQNPYIGPRSFATGERLYGRDRELRRLRNLLIAERIVLLYSPSGAGKTSLVQAALVPSLREEEFQVLPPIRVGAEPPAALAQANRYVLSTMLSIEGQRPAEEQIPLAELANLSLDTYLERISDPAQDGIILIFDQFEEALAVVPNDRPAKLEFFHQLGIALRNQQRWALFSMREDYIAQLDPFLREIPTRLTQRMRLDLLDAESALAAIQQPAQTQGVTFLKDAAQKLIDDLRMVRIQRSDGSTAEEMGLYVEPVQLQVVCYRLWSNLPADDCEICTQDVAKIGDVTSALRAYYAERIAGAATNAQVSERQVRDWCETKLITSQGLRGQVLREPEQSGGLPNRAIAALVDSHLVRGEQIRGAIWYELAHDRLVAPVQADNAEWRNANLNQLQRQAELWEREGRQDGLLFRDQALDAAEAWAAEHADALNPVEQDFLDRCRAVQAIIRRERRNNKLIRGLAIVATLVSIVAGVLAFLAVSAEQKAHVRQLASAALADGMITPQRSLLLALASQQVGNSTMVDGEEALQQLLTISGGHPEALAISPNIATLNADGSLLAIYHEGDAGQNQIVLQAIGSTASSVRQTITITTEITDLALNHDGSLIAAISKDGQLLLWGDDGHVHPIQLPTNIGSVSALTFSQNGATFVLGNDSGHIFLWPVSNLNSPPKELIGADQYVTALAVSPKGEQVAVGYLSGDVEIMSFHAGSALVRKFLHRHSEGISVVDYSPDGQHVASGSTDSYVIVSSVESRSGTFTFRDHTSPIFGLHFSPDGHQIISSSRDGTAQIWSPFNTKQQPRILRGHEGWVLDARFVPETNQVITVGRDGSLRRWNVNHPQATTIIYQHTREVASVAYSPDGRWFATGSIDKSVGLWAVTGEQIELQHLFERTGSVWLVAFSPDSRLLASASEDGNVRVWDVANPTQPLQMINAHQNRVATAVGFSPDGRYMASVGYDGGFHLWEISHLLSTGEMTEVPTAFTPSPKPLQTLAFSEDGRYVAIAGDSSEIQIWDMQNLQAAPQRLQVGDIYALAFRPGYPGQLAAAGFEAKIYLWDLNGPDRTPRVYVGHTDWIIGLAFSPDGQTMASASNDNTVRVWKPDLPGGDSLVLRGHSADAKTVSFSRDGQWLASGALDATAIIWPLDRRVLIERACRTAGRNLSPAEVDQAGGAIGAELCP